MQQRRGTASQWISTNSGNGPILAAGEIGFESDTNKFKIGDGINHWVDLVYFTDVESALGAISGLVDGAPGLLDTLNEIAAAINDDPNFFSTVSTNLSNHASDTTNIHGIANTADLATQQYVDDAVGNAEVDQSTLAGTGLAWNISTGQFDVDSTIATKTYADTAASNAVAAIVDSAPGALNTLNELAAAINDDASFAATVTTALGDKAPLNNPAFTGTVDVSGAQITGVANPTINSDAANKGYVITTGQTAIGLHNDATTGVHGISDTADLVYTGDSRLSDQRTPLDDSVSGSKLQDDAVSINKIQDNAVTTVKIANSNVTKDKIADSAVETDKINNSAVTEAKIANNAVTTDKIADLNVTEAKINNAAVTEDKIGTGAVTEGKIADLAVTSAKIAGSTIVDSNISTSAAIAQSKIDGLVSDLADKATSTDLDAHTIATTSVHGIVDTSALATKTYADTAASSAVLIHNSDTTSVHGIADTSLLVTTTGTQTLISKTLINPAITDRVDTTLYTPVPGYNMDTDSNNFSNMSQIMHTVDFYIGSDSQAVSVASETTHVVVEGADGSSGTYSVVSYNSGTQKFTLSAPGVMNLTELQGSMSTLISRASKSISSAEISYLDGVTSNIQTQLDDKASSSDLSDHNSDTTSVHGISDTSQLAYKNAEDQTFTGNMEIDGNLVVDGDFTVNGTNFAASATSITIEDNLVQLAHQNAGNTVDLGLVVAYNDGAAKHSGIVRDVSANKWKLFKGVTTEPSTTVDFTQGSLDDLEVAEIMASSITVGDVSNTEFGYLNGVTSAIQTQLDDKLASSTAASTYETISNVDLKAPKANPTFTGTVTVGSDGIAFSDKTQTKAGVPSLTTIATAVSSSTTLDALGTDAGVRDSLIPLSGAVNISFEATGNDKYAIGSSINFYQSSGTGANITGNGITILSTPGSTLRTTYSSVTATKVASTTWLLAGDLKA